MATWLAALIGFGVVVVVAAVGYVIWRWGGKKTAITTASLSVATVLLGVVRSFLKDDKEKLDAYDFVAAGEQLSKRMSEIIKKHGSGASFMETRTEMVAAVKEIVAEFPQLDEKLTDELIEREVDAVLLLISNIPKVKDIIKK